jgi:glycogen phosphorylase
MQETFKDARYGDRVKAIRRFTVRTVLPEALAPLEELATNLRWSWHRQTGDVFRAIDEDLWQACDHDPVRFLGEVSAERLHQVAADQGMVDWIHRSRDDLRGYLTGERWYQSLGEQAPRSIAYFSPEYGIAAALPQYSGGLGILAGDHLKAASDLAVSIIGIGLFYRAGYFRQSLTIDGWQVEQYPICDPHASAVTQLRDADGQAVKVTVALPGGRELTARIWVASVGRVPLLLLDSDVEENAPAERDVTDRLYGGEGEHRLQQEMLLGIGGVRAVRAYCALTGFPAPEVFHTNEGHAGFLGLERIRELMQGPPHLTFAQALEATRAGTIFTTHTPVPAGIDRFPRELIETYFGGDNAEVGLDLEQILQLGAESYPGGDPGVFNMAVMGLRLAQRANGVSLLHGSVSRSMFAGLWPGFDAQDVPIISITNGVHAPTWVAREVQELAREVIGDELVDQTRGWEAIADVPSDRIWSTKRRLREHLVAKARQRLRESWLQRGATIPELKWIDGVLDPDILTIGFARRVPSYKRLTLMLRDPDRLRALLLDSQRPIQLVVAGKSHPADHGGKNLIQQLVQFADSADVRHRVVFLPDYDMGMAEWLYPGCDVWLNNPIRPLEASGTSGMKAALNGALNLSILDGWWDEWFDGQNGWAIPTANGIEDPERRDDLEADGLYDLIERSVAPTFYAHDEHGLPQEWIAMVRHTLQTLGPKVLASRMVREYVDRLYVPAAEASRTFQANDFALAKETALWKANVRAAWPQVRIEHVEVDGVSRSVQMGSEVTIRAYVALGSLQPSDVRVEALFGRVDADDVLNEPDHEAMEAIEHYEGNRWLYRKTITLTRNGPFGYTVRALPSHVGLSHISEMGIQALPMASPG